MFGDPSIPYDPRLDDQPMEDVKDSLTPSDERAAAEETYTRRAFNYEQNPIGSRDWTLFWSGWCARATLASSKEPRHD